MNAGTLLPPAPIAPRRNHGGAFLVGLLWLAILGFAGWRAYQWTYPLPPPPDDVAEFMTHQELLRESIGIPASQNGDMEIGIIQSVGNSTPVVFAMPMATATASMGWTGFMDSKTGTVTFQVPSYERSRKSARKNARPR